MPKSVKCTAHDLCLQPATHAVALTLDGRASVRLMCDAHTLQTTATAKCFKFGCTTEPIEFVEA